MSSLFRHLGPTILLSKSPSKSPSKLPSKSLFKLLAKLLSRLLSRLFKLLIWPVVSNYYKLPPCKCIPPYNKDSKETRCSSGDNSLISSPAGEAQAYMVDVELATTRAWLASIVYSRCRAKKYEVSSESHRSLKCYLVLCLTGAALGAF